MFDLSPGELLLIVAAAVIFIGPKELPAVIQAMGKAMRAIKGLAGEIRQAFGDLARESGAKDAADEVNREIRMIKGDDGKFYESYDTSKLPRRE